MRRSFLRSALIILNSMSVSAAEFTVEVSRPNIQQGDPIEWTIKTDQAGDLVRVFVTRDGWRHELYHGPMTDGMTAEGGWLAEGDYTIHAELSSGDEVVAADDVVFGIFAPLGPSRETFHVFSWGVHWGNTATGERSAEEIVADLAAHHIDLATLATGDGRARPFGADQAYFADVGLRYRVGKALNLHTMHKPLPQGQTHEAVASQAADGSFNAYYGQPTRCYSRADAVTGAIEWINKEYLHPQVRDMLGRGRFTQVTIDDELGLGYTEDFKIACYCKVCRDLFGEQYGRDLPLAEEYAAVEPAIVPDDHPWLSFFHFRSRQIPKYLSALADHARAAAHPDTAIVTQQIQGVETFHGANLDHWTDWQDVINLHAYPGGSSPSTTAFAVDIWRQGDVLRRPGRARPMWLMIQASWGAPLPETGMWPLPYATAQVHMAMASGVQSIGLFTYNGLRNNNSAVHDYEWFAQLADLLGSIKQLGGLWMIATPAPKRVALLNSFTTDAFMITRGLQEGYWYQFHIGEQAHASLLRAHVPIEVIGEEAIRLGRLSDYDALVLMHCHYLPKSVADGIAAFISDGGRVYCDEQTGVPLEGLTRLPFVFTHHRQQCAKAWAGTGYRDSRQWEPQVRRQAKHLADELAWVDNWYTVDDVDTVARGFDLPGARMLYLVNSAMQNYSKNADERVDPAAVTANVSVAEATAIYDLLQHEQVQPQIVSGRANWTVKMDGGGGAIYLLVDEPIGRLDIQMPRSVLSGMTLDVGVSIANANGADLWPGTAPLEVTLTDTGGHVLSFGGPVAAVRGLWRGHYQLARNAPPGQWTVHVRNLADGRTSAASVQVVGQARD